MSATAQNFFYCVGKVRKGKKENTLTVEEFEQMVKSAEKFMPKIKFNELETRDHK